MLHGICGFQMAESENYKNCVAYQYRNFKGRGMLSNDNFYTINDLMK